MPANSTWFDSAIRVFPIVAVGLGLGGAIGGYAGLAVTSALIEPPRQDMADTSRRGGAATEPVRAVPSATQQANSVPATASAAPPATISQGPAISEVQSPLTPWPDALTRSHPPVAVAETPGSPAPTAAPIVPTPNVQANDATRAAATEATPRADAAPQSPQSDVKATQAKRRSGHARRSNNLDAAAAARTQPVYDYYGDGDRYRDGADAAPQSGHPTTPDPYRRRTGPGAKYNGEAHHGVVTATRVPRQLQDSADRRDEPQSAVPATPPQPPPPLFGGLFGGGDRYDDGR